MKNIGIIDIGSNTIHLIIIKIDYNGKTKILDQDKEHLRLGENINTRKNIDSDKILNTVITLKKYLRLCLLYNVDDIIAVATEALRVAENSSFIIDYIKKHTGLSIKILSKEEEAFLSYLGVASTYNITNTLIMDLGGNSTELISVRDGIFANYVSLPIGAINVYEKINLSKEGRFYDCTYSEDYFNSIFSNLPIINNKNDVVLFGVGGTFKNLKNIYKNISANKNLNPNYLELESDTLINLCIYLKNLSSTDRINLKGLSKKRCDIILGGCEIIINSIKYHSFKKINICDEGLRTGILSNYLNPKISLK